MRKPNTILHSLIFLISVMILVSAPAQVPYVHFESGHVRPLAMSPDATRLIAVNTSDNHIEIFSLHADGMVLETSLLVGLEPVAVAFRNNSEVWVVNHLSDSISIVDLSGTPRIKQTLLVGDEPRDIVFTANDRAFITTAHRGQHRTHSSISAVPGAGDPQLTTASVPRADVWVFDGANPGALLGGLPLKIIELFGDTPRALAVSPDGATVYAAVFMSGNQTAVVNEDAVCNGFGTTECAGDGITSPNGLANGNMPGGLPGPSANVHADSAPETGLIVKYDEASGEWRDQEQRNWSNGIRFTLPDYDVFAIDSATLSQTQSYSGVGTTLFNMITHPVTGDVFVSNTEAINEVRFEGDGVFGGSTVQGNLAQSRITMLTPTSQVVRHLNSHIDYATTPAPAGIKDHSLATPLGMAFSGDGQTLYVAAFGSGKIGVLSTADYLSNQLDPATDSVNYLNVPGGPTAVVLDEARGRLYVSTRFDNSLVAVDLSSGDVIAQHALHNPEPASVREGRPFLYDANLTSSNGEASCSSCHIFGDMDGLSWDLGNPGEEVIDNPITINLQAIVQLFNQASPNINGTGNINQLHPMKGPMTTQTLRGMANSGAMHWRGDRSVGVFGTDAADETVSFLNFNVAFPGLVGRDAELNPLDMAKFTSFALDLALPPNPVRALNNTLNATEQAGQNFYLGSRRSDGSPIDFTGGQDGFTCDGCHELNPALGRFGTSTNASFENEEQIMKVAHLRNMYQKVGMFGMSDSEFFIPTDVSHQGEQVRGTGFLHDGSVDTLLRFFSATVFNGAIQTVGFTGAQDLIDMEQYMLAFDTDLAPITGQQITLTTANDAQVTSRIDLLINRADALFVSKILGGTVTEADVVVSGTINGEQKNWQRLSNGQFKSDVDADVDLSLTQLKNLLLSADDSLTFTAVPPGMGLRVGIDRDTDGILNADDNCPAHANTDQLDDDSDMVGNLCDNCTVLANTDQRDTNGDGYGNMCDPDLNNDGIVNFGDVSLWVPFFNSATNGDADFNGDGFANFGDYSIYPAFFLQAPGPSALVP